MNILLEQLKVFLNEAGVIYTANMNKISVDMNANVGLVLNGSRLGNFIKDREFDLLFEGSFKPTSNGDEIKWSIATK